MKKIIFITFIILIENIWAKCNTEAIIMKKDSSFGLSISGSGTSTNSSIEESFNVPFSINNEAACFVKKSKYVVKTESTSEKSKEKIIIKPMKVEFENVPEPSLKQYIFVEKGIDNFSTKIYSMAFICADELPLAIEGYADSYLDLRLKSANNEVSIETTFATGIAADNLKKSMNNSIQSEALTFFAKKFLMETKDLNYFESKLPSIFTESSINTIGNVERSVINSFYTIGTEMPNGCSKTFADKMQNYLIENYEKNDSLKNFKVSKKWFRDDIVLEWN